MYYIFTNIPINEAFIASECHTNDKLLVSVWNKIEVRV